MNDERGVDTPEEVLKFAPKKNEDAKLDDAENAIVTKIRTAADLAHGVIAPCPWHTNFQWSCGRARIEHIN